MNTIPLNAVDLVLAAALLIVNGIISVVFGLRLERSLAIAAIRMVSYAVSVARQSAPGLGRSMRLAPSASSASR